MVSIVVVLKGAASDTVGIMNAPGANHGKPRWRVVTVADGVVSRGWGRGGAARDI